MKEIQITNRNITPKELARIKAGFDENSVDNAVEIQTADRYGFAAQHGDDFIGCSSGLAHKNGEDYSGWFSLTDLFVEKEYRHQGIGAKLLLELEREIAFIGVRHVWVWTAGYEAPGFYQKMGYEIFAEMEGWYSDGSSRVGLRKKI